MKTKDLYSQCEIAGRSKFNEMMSTQNVDVQFTEDSYDHLDAYFTTDDDEVYGVEIKNRSEKFECYDTFIFEKIKFDYMTKQQDLNKTKDCFYILYFGDHCYIYKWTKITKMINDGELSEGYYKLPDSTVDKHRIVEKKCIYLPKTAAYVLEKKYGKWKLRK